MEKHTLFLKSENSQEYDPLTSKKLYVHEFGFSAKNSVNIMHRINKSWKPVLLSALLTCTDSIMNSNLCLLLCVSLSESVATVTPFPSLLVGWFYFGDFFIKPF